MGKTSVLNLDDVSVAYRKRKGWLGQELFWALSEVSLDIYPGEILAVIGRNGAGKSTLLQLLAGIISPDKGAVNNIGNVHVSLLAMQLGFISHLTGRENAILGTMFLGIDRQKSLERLEKVIEFAELDGFIDQPINTYSSGMRARLGFAVALQAEPDVLLIDEAMSAGDHRFKEKANEAIRDKLASEKTIVLVSHSLGVVEQLCDRAILLHRGGLEYTGTPKEVIERYKAL